MLSEFFVPINYILKYSEMSDKSSYRFYNAFIRTKVAH